MSWRLKKHDELKSVEADVALKFIQDKVKCSIDDDDDDDDDDGGDDDNFDVDDTR